MSVITYDYTVIEATDARASKVIAIARDEHGAEIARSDKHYTRSDAIAELRKKLREQTREVVG